MKKSRPPMIIFRKFRLCHTSAGVKLLLSLQGPFVA
jgi:hypothetical protein